MSTMDNREKEIRDLQKRVRMNLVDVAIECNEITNPHLVHLKQLCEAVDDLFSIVDGLREACKAKDALIKINSYEASRIHKFMHASEQGKAFLLDTRPCTDSLIDYAKSLQSQLAAAREDKCKGCFAPNCPLIEVDYSDIVVSACKFYKPKEA
jgi:hypothetical protein